MKTTTTTTTITTITSLSDKARKEVTVNKVAQVPLSLCNR